MDRDAQSRATYVSPNQQAFKDRLTLMSEEIYWRDHQVWLSEQGYMLRPRYRPGWVPSWKNSGKRWMHFEDGIKLMVSMYPLLSYTIIHSLHLLAPRCN